MAMRRIEKVDPPIAFVFTGQGSQYKGMGYDLYENQPAFRAAFDRCDRTIFETWGRSLTDLLFCQPYGEAIADPTGAQLALFSVGYSLVEMWSSWGIANKVADFPGS